MGPVKHAGWNTVTKDPVRRQKHFEKQFVLPHSMIEKALAGLHDLASHQGQARTVHLARQHFFWPKMERRIRDCQMLQEVQFGKNT